MADESRDSEGALRKIEADKLAAEKMRKEALEQFGETKKDLKLRVIKGGRLNEGRVEMMQWSFLKEKTEEENQSLAEELASKKQHQQQEAARQGRILAIMQQQQQQTAAMKTLIDRLLPKKS